MINDVKDRRVELTVSIGSGNDIVPSLSFHLDPILFLRMNRAKKINEADNILIYIIIIIIVQEKFMRL